MFCEYMDSGRRDKLSGQNGMYDLYEAELLGKLIVNELHTVNSNLEQIQNTLGRISIQLSGIMANQQMLYTEVAEGNRIAGNICSEITRQIKLFLTAYR